MTCPWCPMHGSRGQIHRHLVDVHAEAVETRRGDAEGRMHYAVRCPRCGGEIRHEVKPRWGDPAFLAHFEREIRLVAFDLLLYHLADAHPEPMEA